MIRNFKEGIELKKRRWKMKFFDKTFCGSDAVDWFLLYLRSNQKFGDHVTRVQSKQLLQKFLENNIFEDARGKEGRSFEDDSHLYRFTEKADQICKSKTELVTQRSVTNLIRSVSIRRTNLSKIITESEGREICAPPNRSLSKVSRSQSMRQALRSPRNSKCPPEPTGLTPLAENLNEFNIDSSKKNDKNNNATKVSSLYPEEQISEENINQREIDSSVVQQSQFNMSNESHYCSILNHAGIDNRAYIVEEMSPLVSTFSRTRSLRDPRAMRYRHKFVVNCDEEDSLHEPSLNLHKSIRRSTRAKRTNSNEITGLKFSRTDQSESPAKKFRIEQELLDCSTSTQIGLAGNNQMSHRALREQSAIRPVDVPTRRKLRSSAGSESSLVQMQRSVQDKARRTNRKTEAVDVENILKGEVLRW